jgi:CPA2 family monovalent cation:H+ antiporter-2
LLFTIIFHFSRKLDERDEEKALAAAPAPPRGHVVVIGYGRVGSLVGRGLIEAGERPTIVEVESDADDLPAAETADILLGNAASPALLARTDLVNARMLLVAIRETFEAGQIVEQARAINPALRIIARAHSDAEIEYLQARGADLAIMGEQEIAKRMIEQARRAK